MIELDVSQLEMKQALDACIAGEKTVSEVAMKFGYTKRGIELRLNRYRRFGDQSLIHGNTGKKHPRPGYTEKAERLVAIFSQVNDRGLKVFENVNYTEFTEIVNEDYKVKCGVTWVSKLLKGLGHLSPWHHRGKNDVDHHNWRPRMESTGQLVQIDGTPYDWFGDGHMRCLHAGIDDASGNLVGAYMAEHECLLGYLEVFRLMFINHGVPEALYSDRTRLLFKEVKEVSKAGNIVKVERPDTQLGKIVQEFGIDVIAASSPQAKGRVERLWRTVQDRLSVQFRLHNIHTVEDANKFLVDVFIPKFNKKFGHVPKSDKSAFVPASVKQIGSLLRASFLGCTDNSGVVSLKGYRFYVPGFTRRKVLLCLSEKEGIWAEVPGDRNFVRYPVRLCETDTTGPLPEVYKLLVEKVFLQNAKPKFREVYYEPGTVLDDIGKVS